MKGWPTFKVAAQVSPSSNIIVRDIRAPNLEEMKALLRRLLNIGDLGTLSFFEVHIATDEGTEIVVGSPDQEWPKGATVETHTVVYSPKVPGALHQTTTITIKDADGKDKTPVIVGPLGPEPVPVPMNMIQALSAKSKERRAKAAAENIPKETFRPVRIHKREVA
jgi:hypothetical protein